METEMQIVSYEEYFEAFDRVKELGVLTDIEIHKVFLEEGFTINPNDEKLNKGIEMWLEKND